jgi:hypothetical protein
MVVADPDARHPTPSVSGILKLGLGFGLVGEPHDGLNGAFFVLCRFEN